MAVAAAAAGSINNKIDGWPGILIPETKTTD
jgi:hypothetical protein